VGRRWIRRLFGPGPVAPGDVRETERMLQQMSQSVAAAFYPALAHHDKATLPALGDIPTLVLCGSEDRLIPPRHSRRIAQEIGGHPRRVEVAGGGHMVTLTHAWALSHALAELLGRATDGGR
jgi:pimeloyl-ACP methyl ester carboxylesterase